MVTSNSQSESNVEYTVNFYPRPDLFDGSNNYFVGWVEGYKSSDGTTVEGYPNEKLQNQPVFLMSEDVSTGKTAAIRLSSQLSPDLRNFIISIVDQFSPVGRNSRTYKESSIEERAIPITDETGQSRPSDKSEILTVLHLLQADTNVAEDGRLSEVIEMSSDNFVRSYGAAYTFSLKAADMVTAADDTTVKIDGNHDTQTHVYTQLTLTSKTIPSEEFMMTLQKILDADTTVRTFVKEELDRLVEEDFAAEIQKNADSLTVDPLPK